MRRTFTLGFKLEVAELGVNQGYSIEDACKAVDVSTTAMRSWVRQFENEHQVITPVGSKAQTIDQRRIQELKARLRQGEREKDILKKATVDSIDLRSDEVIILNDRLRAQYRRATCLLHLMLHAAPHGRYRHHRQVGIQPLLASGPYETRDPVGRVPVWCP